MFDFNNLTPWDDQRKMVRSRTLPKMTDIISLLRKKQIHDKFVSPVIPKQYNIKTPTFIQINSEVQEPIISMQRRRLSVQQHLKKRKIDQVEHLLPFLQTSYPIESQQNIKHLIFHQNYCSTKASNKPFAGQITNNLNGSRKCLNLHNIPQLKTKSIKQKKSLSQVTLHNLQYHNNIKLKPNSQALLSKQIRQTCLIKKKQFSLSKVRNPVTHKNINVLKFNGKSQRNTNKYFSQQRLDHFLDKLLSKMH